MDTTSKKDLLKAIAEKELARLEKLNEAEMTVEADDWFLDSDSEGKSREDNLNDLFEDFMAWREGECVEELQEVLKRYDEPQRDNLKYAHFAEELLK
jgi:hypothetical protein